MRILLDTCVIIDWLTDSDPFDDKVWDILNQKQAHKDPSDHVIISHAITEHLTLLSSDDKFPYYRNQGLELIEYQILWAEE